MPRHQVREVLALQALPGGVADGGVQTEAVQLLRLPVPDHAAVVDVEELAVAFGVLFHRINNSRSGSAPFDL